MFIVDPLHFLTFFLKDAFQAFHNDMKKVGKYLKTIQIGKVLPESDVNEDEPLKVKITLFSGSKLRKINFGF